MKKLLVILFVFLVVLSIVIAQENQDSETLSEESLAYQCLENQIEEKESSSLSLEEAIFSALALGKDDKLINRINNDALNGNCWPKSACNLKNTAQVLLAYDRINRNTKDIESWLLSKENPASELTWFLQVDITNKNQNAPVECTLVYKNSQNTITIENDLTLSGNPGNCFTLSSSGYWLRVREQCLDEPFQISCEQDFITSLLYQKQDSSTLYISPETHSAASSGTTEEKINSKCFKLSSAGACDYEGTLWAALALSKKGIDVSNFLPYLLAMSEDNKQLFPSSFLYSLTSGDDQYSEIIQSQKQNQFWQSPSTKYNKFYDTALALLALQSTSAPESENAKSYLLSIQTPQGCWNNNNIRDTSFLLYAGFPTEVPTYTGGDDNGRVIIIPKPCEPSGFFCESTIACVNGGGIILEGYSCPGFGGVCCDIPIIEKACFDKGGNICSASQTCSGTVVSSSEGSCCLGTCENTPQLSDCERLGGSCKFSCDLNSEEETFDSCDDASSVCCILSIGGDSGTSETGNSNLIIWIIALSALILVIILLILLRNRIRMAFFRPKRTGLPPSGALRRPPMPPPVFSPRTLPQRRPGLRPKTRADKDFEDTLNKLKDISK